jgi:receptor protein-tyrosine kinase
MSIIEKAVDRFDQGPGRPGGDPGGAKGSVAGPREGRGGASSTPAGLAGLEAPQTPSRVSRQKTINLDPLVQAGILTPGDTDSQLAEECRLIKRPLLVNAFGTSGYGKGRRNLVMVTSSLPGEGKTFVSLSLAMSMAAELDRTVLLVDGDVVRGTISHILGVEGEQGLTDALSGEGRDLAEFLLRTDVPKLTVLPAGRPHAHPTELLASDAMSRLADEISERYPDRIVMFDSPPLLAASGATVLARQVGQIVVVVEAEKTAETAVKESLRLLKGLPVAGLLLNKAREHVWARYSYGYRYGYGYGYRSQPNENA